MTIREQSDILSLKFLSDTRTTVVMYRVFLSYNTAPDEMVVVWRLQTLAAASGLHVDVPNPIQRADWPTIMRMIADADSIIAFLTKKASRQVKNEISYAMSRGKPIIPIIEQGVSVDTLKPVLDKSGTRVFWLDPHKAWEMEKELAQYLQKEKMDKDARNALLALAGTFVGLYLLQQLTES